MLGQLYDRVERQFPALDHLSCARLCLLIIREHGLDSRQLDKQELQSVGKRLRWKFDQASDQYDAVTAELKSMAASKPSSFGQDQVWTLLRALKIQDQLLKMHIGGELLNV